LTNYKKLEILCIRQYRRELLESKEVYKMFAIDTLERQQCLEESIKELERVNKNLSKLVLRKEELTDAIIGSIGHEHEGQKTYEYNIWKIEVKTPFVYSLDKKVYESGKIQLPKEFNPIKKSVSYSIDKGLCDRYIDEAPEDVRECLVQLIEKKPGKASVVIKERV